MATPTTSPPLSVGSLLQRTLDLVGRHLAVLLWCVVLVVTPLVVLGGVLAVALGSGGLRTYNLGSTLMALLAAFGGLVGVAACMYTALQDRAGLPVTAPDALRYGLRWYPRILGVTLVAAVAVFAGLIACIVPGIFLAVRLALAVPALLVEGRPVMESLRRSWNLVERRWWGTFGLLLAGYLLPAVIAFVLQPIILALFGLAVEPRSPGALIGLGVAQILGACVTMPFTAIYLVLLYTEMVATQPAVAPAGGWPPPAAVDASPTPVAPPPAVPATLPADRPLPGGFLPPAPAPPPAGDGLAPPPERPPGAGE